MSPLLLVAVAAAGGAGAVVRWMLEATVNRRTGGTFPWGVLVVNISGSFALGVVVAVAGTTPLADVIGTGFLGGYTTFSSVAATTALLADRRLHRAAILNASGSLVLSVAAAVAGIALGRALV